MAEVRGVLERVVAPATKSEVPTAILNAVECPVCEEHVFYVRSTDRRVAHWKHPPESDCELSRPETQLHLDAKNAIASLCASAGATVRVEYSPSRGRRVDVLATGAQFPQPTAFEIQTSPIAKELIRRREKIDIRYGYRTAWTLVDASLEQPRSFARLSPWWRRFARRRPCIIGYDRMGDGSSRPRLYEPIQLKSDQPDVRRIDVRGVLRRKLAGAQERLSLSAPVAHASGYDDGSDPCRDGAGSNMPLFARRISQKTATRSENLELFPEADELPVPEDPVRRDLADTQRRIAALSSDRCRSCKRLFREDQFCGECATATGLFLLEQRLIARMICNDK